MYMYVYVCIARCIIVTEMKKKRISEELPHFRKFRQCGLGGGGTEAGVLGSRVCIGVWGRRGIASLGKKKCSLCKISKNLSNQGKVKWKAWNIVLFSSFLLPHMIHRIDVFH